MNIYGIFFFLFLYMANIKRILLFLIGCMGTRLFLIFMKDKIFGYIEILIGLSFLYIFFTNSR